MLTAFVLSLALAAPVPPPAPPVAGGPLPRLVELKGDADGKIMVTVMRNEVQKITVTTAGPNGAPVTSVREVPVPKIATVELADVKDLKVTTADGKKLDVADAVKALKGGATVVVSADGKPVSPNYLKLFKDDVLVLASPELNVPVATPVFGGGLRPQPFPGQPIQIQIQPGQIQLVPLQPAQAVPAVPAVPAKPAPAPAPEKPAQPAPGK